MLNVLNVNFMFRKAVNGCRNEKAKVRSTFPDNTDMKVIGGYHLDLSGSRDAVGHVTICSQVPQVVISYTCSFATKAVLGLLLYMPSRR